MNLSKQMIKELSKVRPGFADGFVVHNRKVPKPHRFKYHMCWCLFDLDKLNHWMRKSSLWRHNKLSVFSLYDKDYINQDKRPIKEKLKTFLLQQTGVDFNGQIYLFTHPRFLGYGFNSVNFYFCYSETGLQFIVSEITNTPWGEKHLYLHDCATASESQGEFEFSFDKQFHISPFMEMQMSYSWRFRVTPERIGVKMAVDKNDVNVLNVVLDTKITPVMDNNINTFPLKRSFQPWKMSLGIYWQAFRLWLKKVPFHAHPKTINKEHESKAETGKK